MPNIDDLYISLTSNANDVMDSLNRVASALEKMSRSSSRVKKKVDDLVKSYKDASEETEDMDSKTETTSEHFYSFADRLNKVKNSIKEFGDKASKTVGPINNLASSMAKLTGNGIKMALYGLPKHFGGKLVNNIVDATQRINQFFNAIKRIAMYRLIRIALKAITQGFSEGIKNLYAWSAAMDGRFAASMDKLATAFLYMKNSMAALVSPLIDALAPAIDFVVDKFVDMFNIVNQIFARLTGQTTYTAAKKYATAWDDSAKSIKKSTNEIKKSILGFDEINRLNGANGTSGGSGGSAIDAGSMFETKPISSWIQEMVDGGDFSALGTIVAQKINEALGNINWTNIKKKAKGIADSLVSFINGFIKDINPETLGNTIAEVINTAAGTIATFWNNTKWAQAGQKLRRSIRKFFEDLDVEKAAEALLGPFKSLVTLVYNAIPRTKEEWSIIGTKVKLFIQSAINNIPFTAIGDVIGNLIKGGMSVISDLAEAGTLTKIADGIKEAIEKACKQITKDDVARFVNAVLGDVLSAISVLFSIELKLGDMSFSPLSLLTFGVLAKALLSKMIRDVFGRGISLLGAAKGLAWGASISIALDAGIQIAKVIKDITSGEEINAQDICDIVSKLFEAAGFALLASGHLVGGLIALGIGISIKFIISKLSWEEIKGNLLNATVPQSLDIDNGKFNMVVDAYGNFMMVPKSGNGFEVTGSGNGTKYRLINGVLSDVKANLNKVNGKNYNGQTGASLGDLLFPGAHAETTVGVKANQYSQEWYNKNIAPLEAGAKNRPIEVPVNLVKSAVSTVGSLLSSLFGGKKEQEQKIDVKTNLVKGNWSLLNSIIDNPQDVKINLTKNDWTTMDKFLDLDRIHNAKIGLMKNLWVLMDTFLDLVRVHVAKIMLQKQQWSVMDVFLELNRVHTAKIGVQRSGWQTMSAFLTLNQMYFAMIGLKKQGWSTLEKFIGNMVWVGIKLYNASGYKSVAQFLGVDKPVTVNLRTNNSSARANDGVFSNNVWSDLPQYARGTNNAHGTMFLAGEAGPEIVGHVGGRTEVLNKSQLAAAMYSAVQAAMAPAAANFASAAAYMNDNSGSYGDDSMTAFMEMIQRGSDATERQNDLLRQQNDYLRQINDKDFTAEVSTYAINNANRRTNRRAGMTIAPVGT